MKIRGYVELGIRLLVITSLMVAAVLTLVNGATAKTNFNAINMDFKTVQSDINDLKNDISKLQKQCITRTEFKPVISEITKLTKENEWLRMENEDLKNQVREFGWLKEAE